MGKQYRATAHWAAGGKLREKKGKTKRKNLNFYIAFGYCSFQSTVHENCCNSQSGKKWQLKIGQNMPKTSSNPNFCLVMRHNEAQVHTIQTNLAHLRTKFKLKFTQKKTCHPSNFWSWVLTSMSQENLSQNSRCSNEFELYRSEWK